MTSNKILKKSKERQFRELPKFNANERSVLFLIDSETRKLIKDFKTNENKVGFILQRGYFGAKGTFFEVADLSSRPKDKKYIEKYLGLEKSVNLNKYSYRTALNHRKKILEEFGWIGFDKESENKARAHALLQVDKQKSKEDTFFEVSDFCWENRIEIPSYQKLESLVNDSYLKYETLIMERLDQNITTSQKRTLSGLLKNPEVVTKFTELRMINQGEGQKILNYNARILNIFKDTFLELKPLIDEINLSPEAIKHFADWIYRSDISQIKQLKNKTMLFLRLTAFINDQFYLRQDYALMATVKRLKKEINHGRKHQREIKIQNESFIHESSLSMTQSFIDLKAAFKLVDRILKDNCLTDSEQNGKVRNIVESILISKDDEYDENASKLMEDLADSIKDLDFYDLLFSRSETIQKALSPFIQTLIFDDDSNNQHLLNAIKLFQDKKDKMIEEISFLTTTERQLLERIDDYYKISKFKILLFIHIANAIKNQDLTLAHTYRHRNVTSYMISDDDWKLKKTELLSALGLDKFSNGKSILDKIGTDLTKTYEKVNDKYLAGDNKYLKVNSSGYWRLMKIPADFDSSKFIPNLLSNNQFILLYDLLAEIDQYTDFTSAFRHYLKKGSKEAMDKKLTIATLMSIGNNHGHHNMSRSAKGISRKNLRDTERLYFTVENIQKCNDILNEFINKLSIPTIYNQEDFIHTSSDGKKIVVAVNSILANHSFKYYGREQGVGVNAGVDQQQRFYHVNVLASTDREAAYMLDSLVKAKSSLFRDGKIEHKHSTDTHGYTEAIFAGLHFLNVSFAPRIKNVHEQTIYGYESKTLRKNNDSPIAPKTSINKKLILKNWDSLLRLMATIKLGYCSASQMFKILASSKKDNEIYKAMKEFGRLLKSKFILEYINDESLRKAIQKQLNRVELGQKLSEAVFFARKGKLYVGTPDEMQKVVESTRLIKNAIILWNYLFLSDYYYSLESGDEKRLAVKAMSNGSVISWKHINMHGVFDFDHQASSSFSTPIKELLKMKIE